MPKGQTVKNKLAASKEFYDTSYHQSSMPPRIISKHYKNLARRLAVYPGEKVLDVACGTGEWLLAAHQRGAIINGIDLSNKAIEACREGMPDGQFVVGEAEDLPFPDQTFDLITCLGALEHFIDAETALAEMFRVGKPNARYVILVPNADFLTRRLFFFQGTNQAMIKEDVLSLVAWSEMFEKSGMEVKECWADLHVLSKAWIMRGSWHHSLIRLTQALLLLVWPLRWQYQVFFLCNKKIHL